MEEQRCRADPAGRAGCHHGGKGRIHPHHHRQRRRDLAREARCLDAREALRYAAQPAAPANNANDADDGDIDPGRLADLRAQLAVAVRDEDYKSAPLSHFEPMIRDMFKPKGR